MSTKHVEIYIDGDQVFDDDDNVEIDAFEPFVDADHDVRPSLFGSEHITVAEMIHRVNCHAELLERLCALVDAVETDGGAYAEDEAHACRGAIARARKVMP